jgi:hypothetical protein
MFVYIIRQNCNKMSKFKNDVLCDVLNEIS